MGTNIRIIKRDGENLVQLQCPQCNIWADCDEEQLEGVVSCICPECNNHWIAEVDKEFRAEAKLEL